MGAQTNLVLIDGNTVSHTFVPAGSRSETGVIRSLWEDDDHATTPLGLWTVTERYTKGTGRSTVDKVQYSLALPYTATVDGKAVVTQTLRSEHTYFLPHTSSADERWYLYSLSKALGANETAVMDAIVNRRASW